MVTPVSCKQIHNKEVRRGSTFHVSRLHPHNGACAIIWSNTSTKLIGMDVMELTAQQQFSWYFWLIRLNDDTYISIAAMYFPLSHSSTDACSTCRVCRCQKSQPNIINSLLSVCHQQNLSNCVFAETKNIKIGVMWFRRDVISSDILLSAPSTPLHKSDNTQDYAKSNGGKKIECTGTSFRAQAFPSGISPSYDLWGEKKRWWRGKSECKTGRVH